MRNIIKLAFIIVLAFVLTACGSEEAEEQSGDNQTNEKQSVERQLLELEFELAGFDKENNALNVSFETNLPNESVIYRAILRDEEGTNRLIEYEVMVDGTNEIAFSLDGIDKNTLTDKEYQLVFEFNVTQRTNSNLFTDKSLGGSFEEMDEVYKESEHVQLTDLGDAYSISLVSSNSNPITEDNFSEESK